MWDIGENSNIIQLELGKKVIAAYSSSKKKKCDILSNGIESIKIQLSKEHIVLPGVSWRESMHLSSDEFVLYFGALKVSRNYKDTNIFQIIYDCAKEYYLEDFTHESVSRIFQKGMQYLQEKNYQLAIYEFAKAYYCACFSLETRAIMVNSMINIGGILILNKQYDSALQYGKRACALAISDKFYDPYLKYYSAACTGAVFIRMQKWTNAIEYFNLAYDVIKCINENTLKISTLSVLIQLYMQEHKFVESASLIDEILDILHEDKSLKISEDSVIALARFQAQVYKELFKQQSINYEILYAKYKKISTSFLVQLKNLALNVIIEYSDIIFAYTIGNLLGGEHYFKTQFTFGGTSIQEVNTVTITGN